MLGQAAFILRLANHRRSRAARWLPLDAILLAFALVAGAFLGAAVNVAPRVPVFGILSLFPVFVAIKVARPAAAALAGLLWGVAGVWFTLWLGRTAAPALVELPLGPLVHAAYAGLACALTRRIGFSPFVLSIGWLILELVQRQAGFQAALERTDGANALFLDLATRLLGYSLVGFVAAYVCAMLVSVIDHVVASQGAFPVIRRGGAELRLTSVLLSAAARFQRALLSSGPRAPPCFVSPIA